MCYWVQELITIKKISTIKNISAGAIIVTPKLLAQKHIIRRRGREDRSTHTAHPFTEPPKSYAFQFARHPKSAPYCGGVYVPI